MKPRHRRFAWIVAGAAALGVATLLVLNVFQSNLVFFFTPTQVIAKEAPQGRPFRIGGLVETGSLQRTPNSLGVKFVVTDTAQSVPVVYNGLLPDLFREGKGVVAQGALAPDGTFRATEVLAKHDENYMPPEAAAALERAAKDKGIAMKTLAPAGSITR
ncbi:MAG: cytochrome c maturation protein CcmE [Betaproteobacteria bacterium]|nr:cytochrome c maturation protein CcmE [Betaproteobacteria bacterium]